MGTNGKSSTTRYCEALLRAHGLRAGAYLSPHITGWTERVLVDGRPVAGDVFGGAVERVREAVAGLPPRARARPRSSRCSPWPRCWPSPRAGWRRWRSRPASGGRLDATNVVKAPVVVLTNIALEHTEVLGDTRELIFAEKAAVIKGGDAVFGPLDGLEDEARRVCGVAGARPHFLRPGGDRPQAGDLGVGGSPDDFVVTLAEQAAERAWAGLRVPTPALYQVANAALAVAAVRLLLGRLDAAAAREALAATAVPGRLQKVGERPLVLADGAHNPDGVRALAQSLAAVAVPHPASACSRSCATRTTTRCCELLLPLLDAVVCTQASEARSLAAEELAAALRAAAARLGRPAPAITVEPDPHAALARARELATPRARCSSRGSLYLLEDLRDVLAAAG